MVLYNNLSLFIDKKLKKKNLNFNAVYLNSNVLNYRFGLVFNVLNLDKILFKNFNIFFFKNQNFVMSNSLNSFLSALSRLFELNNFSNLLFLIINGRIRNINYFIKNLSSSIFFFHYISQLYLKEVFNFILFLFFIKVKFFFFFKTLNDYSKSIC